MALVRVLGNPRALFVRDLAVGVGIGVTAARVWWFQNHPERCKQTARLGRNRVKTYQVYTDLAAHLNDDKLYVERHLRGSK